jgi:hypothetical protein
LYQVSRDTLKIVHQVAESTGIILSCSSVFKKSENVPLFVLVAVTDGLRSKLKIYEIDGERMTRLKILQTDSLGASVIHGLEMPELESISQYGATIAVLGRPKGKTANLRMTYKPKKQSNKGI